MQSDKSVDESDSDESVEINDESKNARNSVSDTDWLKLRMRRRLDWVDDEEEEEEFLSEGEHGNIGRQNEGFKGNDLNIQQSHEIKDEMVQNIPRDDKDAVNEVPPEESIGDTGRLFVRNLPYVCTEEDLRKEFNKFGPLAESDAIAESIAHRFNVKKSVILDPESDNLSARLALAETHIIQETKSYLEHNGVVLDSFKRKEKSDNVILVKNTKFGITKEDLTQLFGWYGEIGRIIIPPAQTIAIVEFKFPTEARNAFKNLAYKKFRGLPLYLEKAPMGIFKDENEQNPETNENNDSPAQGLSSADLVESSRDMDDDVEVSSQVTATLFVKNLNFETDEEGLKKAFRSTPGMRSARIKMKNDPKNSGKKLSMGFGFVEYDSLKNAKNSLKAMQGFVLDGHALQLKFSNKGLDQVQRKRKEDEEAKKKQESTKIIVKNLAFETTKKELKELFSAYGQIKTLRLPKKFDGTSRGFGFVEFLTKRDARNVMEKLSDTHLLGRHLVLEYAEEDKDIEELREKVGREFIGNVEGGDGKMRKRRKVDMEDWAESKNEMEE
ncbi:13903_t:CDS:2 [Acaulospora colombiana]|uniref:13903_t:CDS:1 n=1 Tax=Acaulospora colombiana TaxID=27376 RepID=A0ACA9LTT0_9GLOM|nr:13903_t:CDS:2 [Acaulospora colombiana]